MKNLLLLKVLLWIPILLICGVFVLLSNILFRLCSLFGRIIELFLNDIRESCKGTRYENLFKNIGDDAF